MVLRKGERHDGGIMLLIRPRGATTEGETRGGETIDCDEKSAAPESTVYIRRGKLRR